jgi:hypothetical protein
MKVAFLLLVVFLAGCQTTHTAQITSLKRTDGTARMVIMPVDVELSEVTAFGGTEPRAEWTDQAKQYLTAALKQENAAQGLHLAAYDANGGPPEETDKLDQISKLHGAVGQTILLQQLGLLPLPTRENAPFDWTLGPETKALKTRTDADYALFVYVRDSYTSAGRVAVQLVSAILFGVAPPGGQQLGFASLIDLDTGNLVWFNRLFRPTGDLRNAAAAQETAKVLLTGFPK